MSHENKTKEQLISELSELRQRIVEMETLQVQHKQVDEALKESEEMYSTIVEKGNDGIAIAQYGKVRFANSKLLELFGFTLEETVEKPFIDFITPESRELVMERYKKRIAGEQIPNRYEIVLHTKDGWKVPVEINASLIKYEGKPADLAIVRDITDRKRAEEKIKSYTENLENIVEERANELKESEERLKAILTGIGVLITIQNKDLEVIWANQPMRDLWGEVIGQKCYKAYKGLTEPCPDCTVAKVFKEGKTTVSERLSTLPDGTQMFILVTSSPVRDVEGNIIAVVEVDKDITERKKLEQELKKYTENLENIVNTRTKELKESEEKLNAILTGIADLITLQNRDLDIIWVNKPMRALYGDIIGRKCYKVYKRLDEPCDDCYAENVFNEGKTVISERESILPDGSLIQVFITSSPVRDAEGNIVAILEVEKDITEQKKLEGQLIESEAKQQAILSAIGDLITIQNRDLDIIWINQPERDIYGDVIGQKCYDVYKGLTEPCPNCTVEKVLKEEKTLVSEGLVIRPDGRPMNIMTTSSPIRDAEGNISAVIEVVKDITKRTQLETQLKDYADNLEKMVAERTKALKESEEKLEALLRGIGDRITIQNKNLDIIWINQPVKDIFGDITGQKCYEAYKGLTEPCSDCYAGIVFYEEKTLISERTDIRPDGRHINTLVTSSPVKDAEGDVVAIIEVTKDITERKKLESQLKDYTENLEKIVEERTKELKESEAKQQAILSAIGDLITIQNKQLDIIWTNQPEMDIYGDVIGQKCYKAYKGLDTPCPNCTVEMVFNEEKTVISEGMIIRPDGCPMNILTTSSPVRDAEGNIVAVLEAVKDITERKKLEVELRESEERYRGLYESSLDGIVSLDTDGNILECNQAYANLLGYSKEELYALTVYDLTPNKWIESNKKFHNQLLTVGYSEEFEKEYIKNDGSIVSIATRGWSIKNEEEKTIGMWGIVRDITERKQVEKKIKEYTENLEKLVEERTLDLKASEERYRGLYESSIDGIASLDMDGNIIECNQAYANMLGYAKEELYNLSYQALTPDRWYDMETEKVTKQILAKGYSNVYEKEHIKKDGTIFPISIRGWLIKDKESTPTGMWTIVRDISEQKKLERQLKKYTEDLEASEKRYRGLYESSLDGIVFLDLEGNILECNQAFADMLEYTKKQLYNSNYRELFPSKLFDYVAKTLSDQMFTSGYSNELETEAIKKDGTIVSVSVKAWRIKDKENKPIGTWTIVRDITEQKKLESQLKNYAENLEKLVEKRTERLRESEMRYRGLYESSIDGIFYADLNRNITDCNKALVDILGYTKEDLCKLNFFDVTPSKWFKTVEKSATEHMYKTGYSEAYEQEIIKKDGTIIPVSVRVWFVKDKEDRPIGVWGIVRDITERKQSEEKIKEYTKNLEKLVEERALELKELERRYRKF